MEGQPWARMLLFQDTKNGQDGLAGVNQVSTRGHLLLPNHTPGIRALLYEKNRFQGKKSRQSGFSLTNSMDPNC